jgi:hypothetical protein
VTLRTACQLASVPTLKADCEREVSGYSNAVFKKFWSREAAEDFLEDYCRFHSPRPIPVAALPVRTDTGTLLETTA